MRVPAAASVRAMPSPMPLVEPVTSATLLERFISNNASGDASASRQQTIGIRLRFRPARGAGHLGGEHHREAFQVSGNADLAGGPRDRDSGAGQNIAGERTSRRDRRPRGTPRYGLRCIGLYETFQLPSGCRHAMPWTTSSRLSISVVVVKSRQGLDALP
jgi:hypothetical protein